MSADEVIESFENACRALSENYSSHPSEETRVALNMLSKIICQVKSEVQAQKEKSDKENKHIELEQWMMWFTDEE